MIPFEDARQRLLALAQILPEEMVSLSEAAGRWLARDIRAKRTQPANDLSAMDGYAVRVADAPGPWRVVGESAAGRPFRGTVRSCEAVRIFTGASLPEETDFVIIQEDVERNGDTIVVQNDIVVAAASHVRAAGSDFARNDLLIAAGDALTPARIALAAMGGHGDLPVRRRPKVAILSTGDELVPPGTDDRPDTIPCSNAPMLSAMFRDAADVTECEIVPDRLDALTTAFKAAEPFDVIVTTGGASVGDHDLVLPALQASGATIDFWKIAMRPGKPVMAGKLGDAVVIGLPGNPVSAFVTALLLVHPLLAHMAGASDPGPESGTATLGAALPANGLRLDHVRAKVKGGLAHPVGVNDSAMLVALSGANALIVREPGAPAAQSGETVKILRFP